MRPVGRPVAAGGRPGTEELAAGRQSCKAAEEVGYEACPVPLAEPSVLRCVALQVSQQWTRRQHHLSRRARAH
jgi:hypothetical protein